MDILCFGELLVDMVARETSGLVQAHTFDRHAGGAAANVAVQIQKLGGSAGFMGKLGQDAFGEYLVEHLRAYGVNTETVRMDSHRRTTVAFVALDREKAPTYLFYREGGACVNFGPDEVDADAIRKAKCFYFSSLTLTGSPMRESTRCALELARAANTCIALDLNYRSTVWAGLSEAVRAIREILPLVDILKLNTSELRKLQDNPAADAETCGDLLREQPNLRLVILTGGKDGSWIIARDASPINIPTTDSQPPVDTTGAGDSYMAAFLFAYLRSNMDDSPQALQTAGAFATQASEYTIRSPGAIDAMPTAADLGLDGNFSEKR